MMTTPADVTPASREPRDARELQTHLYREIGISAVTAALRFVRQPDPSDKAPVVRDMPAILRDEHKAA